MFDDIKNDMDLDHCKTVEVNLSDFLTETDDENALILEGVLG